MHIHRYALARVGVDYSIEKCRISSWNKFANQESVGMLNSFMNQLGILKSIRNVFSKRVEKNRIKKGKRRGFTNPLDQGVSVKYGADKHKFYKPNKEEAPYVWSQNPEFMKQS